MTTPHSSYVSRGLAWIPTLFFGCLVHLCSTCVSAEVARTVFTIAPESSIRLSGTATLRDWHCANTHVEGHIELSRTMKEVSAFFLQLKTNNVSHIDLAEMYSGTNAPARAVIEADIGNIDCGNRIMESDLGKALRVAEAPRISYRFSRLAGISILEPENEPAALVLHTEGDLSLAGVTRRILVDAHITEEHGGHLSLKAESRFHMSDFDVEPPTTLFGIIKAHDPVWVAFSLRLIPVATPRAVPGS